jgi:NAD(P)-dependent dehydrogenase (short-subunit alcohol dehydrogenase family)
MSPQHSTRDRWAAADIPGQQGRTAVVTGSNTGLGFEIARALAEHGAAVVLACRDTAKASAAADRIRAAAPGATVRTLRLDLASLASVRDAAGQLRVGYPHLDLLISNADAQTTALAAHPGSSWTELQRHTPFWMSAAPEAGANGPATPCGSSPAPAPAIFTPSTGCGSYPSS